MAAQYVQAIRALQANGPYYLAGWSFGGKVAFEIARRLRDVGEEVGLLALIDSVNGPPPPAHEEGGPIRHASRRFRVQLEAMRRLPSRQRLGHVLRKASVATRWAAQRLRDRYEERSIPEPLRIVNSANDLADRTFVGSGYDGKAILFRATGATTSTSGDPTLGWSEGVRGGLEIVDVPGDHFSVVDEPNVQVLARELAARLRAAANRPPALELSEADSALFVR
jgi:oxalate---CoA ligase